MTKIPQTITDETIRIKIGVIDYEIKSRLERQAILRMKQPKPTGTEFDLIKVLDAEVKELVSKREQLLASGSLSKHFTEKKNKPQG